MGGLKPFLTGFVQRGILALKTPEMKACMQKSFCNDGFFGIMRSDEMQQPMRVEFPLPDEDLMAIADGVENDENIEELAFDYEW